MKSRFAALLLAGIMTLSLVACGQQAAENTATIHRTKAGNPRRIPGLVRSRAPASGGEHIKLLY